MDRDGTRDGYDLALIRAVADAVTVPVIASGGVGNLDHLVAGVIEGGASAVLAASIFHFGEATIAEAHARLAAAGLPVDRQRGVEGKSVFVRVGLVGRRILKKKKPKSYTQET